VGLWALPAAWAAGPEEVVITGTRTPEQAQRSTVRTDVVTREEAERRGATNVAEALWSQPGVQLNPGAYGSLGNVSAVQIQGFDRDRVLILEDGERIIGDVGGAIDLSAIPLSDVSRIEIVAGPQSALYGASAIGGVLNVLSAPPRIEGPSGRLRLEIRGPFAALGQAQLAYRDGPTWASAEGNVHHQAGVARGAGDLVLPDINRRGIGVRAGTRLGGRSELRLRARWINERSEGRETQIIPGLGPYQVRLPEGSDRLALHLVTAHDLGGGSGLRVALGKQVYQGASEQRYEGSRAGERRERDYGMQSIEATATLADGPRTWVIGARAEVERFDQRLRKDTIDTGELHASETVEVAPAQLSTLSAYGQLAWRLGAHVTLLPGFREERHSRHGGASAPRLAAAWRPGGGVIARASVGRGFRAPSAKELGFLFDHSFYGYRVEGNPGLVPERSWGASVDLAVPLGGAVTARGSAFGNEITDLIDVDVAHGTLLAGGVTSYRYRNLGRARTAGGQLALAARPAAGLRVELAYDYLYTRDLDGDRPLGGRPPHTLTASVVAPLPARVEAVARLRVASDSFVDVGQRSPGYSQLDLRFSRPLWPGSSGYVGALNLLDVHQDPGRPGDLRPLQGRTLYLGLTAELPSTEDP
jgi:outer membrane receptor for ferrienterochelin and colicins